MSYVNGMIQQKDSLANSQFFRPSVIDASQADVSKGSAYARSSNGLLPKDGVTGGEDQRLLPGTKVDLHILSNVSECN